MVYIINIDVCYRFSFFLYIINDEVIIKPDRVVYCNGQNEKILLFIEYFLRSKNTESAKVFIWKTVIQFEWYFVKYYMLEWVITNAIQFIFEKVFCR